MLAALPLLSHLARCLARESRRLDGERLRKSCPQEQLAVLTRCTGPNPLVSYLAVRKPSLDVWRSVFLRCSRPFFFFFLPADV